MELVPLSPTSPPAHVGGWLRLGREWHAEEMPGVDPPAEREGRADLASDSTTVRGALLAVDDDEGVGFAHWEARLLDNRDLAWLALYVSRPHRHRGVGTRLLDAARDELVALGRSRVASDIREGGAGTAFAAAAGARTTDVDLRSILDLSRTGTAELAALAAAPIGYQLVQFRDRCPDALVDAFAAARAAMNDAPHGDAVLDDMPWDAARLRALEAHRQEFGIGTFTTAAVDETSGDVGGFTEILAVGRPTTAVQDDTGVLRAHRGHGLGLAMKATNLRHLLAHEPQLTRIVTWNAESNRYMRAVNERLGFRVAERWFDLELALADVQISPRSLL